MITSLADSSSQLPCCDACASWSGWCRPQRADSDEVDRSASIVVKEGACLQGRLGGFSASLQGRLDRFSAAGLQGWTAFQQLAFRPLCKQDDITDAAKCGAKVCAERTHFFGLVVHESTVLLLARLSRHAWTNFMRRSRHWRRASQIQLHFRAIFDEHLRQKF